MFGAGEASGPGDATGRALQEVAGAELYRRNAFRITGLSTYADRRAIRERRQKVNTALQVGADVDLGHDLPVEADEVRAAFDRLLDDPRRRLVDELFWLWDTPDATCPCVRSLHKDHDAAVRAHSAALDLEVGGPSSGRLELEKLWTEAAAQWKAILRRAAFWEHVRHRLAALDDRQLDESAVDVLRRELPSALVRPLIELAGRPGDQQGRRADLARRWPAPELVVDDRLEELAAPMYETLRTTLNAAGGLLDDGEPERAAGRVYGKVLPGLNRLNALVPHARHRRTRALREDVAILLNNCAMALLDSEGPAAGQRGRRWLDTARDLTTDPGTVETIEQNRNVLSQVTETFQTIKDEATALVRTGRPEVARAYLDYIEEQLGDVPGIERVARLRLDLGLTRVSPGPGPRYTSSVPYVPAPRRGRGLRVAFWVAVLAGAGLLLGQCSGTFSGWSSSAASESGRSTVFADAVADNVPAGSCVSSQAGWESGETGIPTVPCDEPHWGEVLGYVPLGEAVSPYPGGDQVRATAELECRRLQLRQERLPPNQYKIGYLLPGEKRWNKGGGRYENYAPCVVSRIGDEPYADSHVEDPPPLPHGVVVWMDLFGERIADNPPVGSCVRSRRTWGASPQSVDIVRCEEPHWAENGAYVKLYDPEDRWPGDARVFFKAEDECAEATSGIAPVALYRIDTIWPRKDRWEKKNGQIYAVCLVSRADGQELTGRLS